MGTPVRVGRGDDGSWVAEHTHDLNPNFMWTAGSARELREEMHESDAGPFDADISEVLKDAPNYRSLVADAHRLDVAGDGSGEATGQAIETLTEASSLNLTEDDVRVLIEGF